MGAQRFRVLERLDAGGMAELFCGVAQDAQGKDRLVAIKRVLPALTGRRRVVQMFLDEARLGLVLRHDNIVQMHDVGRVDDTYYQILDFVVGVDLRTLLAYIQAGQTSLPLSLAVGIAVEVCQGLAFAHALCDEAGVALRIVHRDLNPGNILLSERGGVKVSDFGLARSRSHLERTGPGLIKGTFAYLSPEAAYGDPVDARADVFAVGILLWEMIAGRCLFGGGGDVEALDLVRRAQVPRLSERHPEVNPALETIVQKALARDKARRFASAAALAHALRQWQAEAGAPFRADDLGAWVQRCRAASQQRWRRGAVEEAVEAELGRFVSVAERAGPGAPPALEAPGTWHDLADLQVLRGKQHGAAFVNRLEPSGVSALIPIDVVHEAMADFVGITEAAGEVAAPAIAAVDDASTAVKSAATDALPRENPRGAAPMVREDLSGLAAPTVARGWLWCFGGLGLLVVGLLLWLRLRAG